MLGGGSTTNRLVRSLGYPASYRTVDNRLEAGEGDSSGTCQNNNSRRRAYAWRI